LPMPKLERVVSSGQKQEKGLRQLDAPAQNPRATNDIAALQVFSSVDKPIPRKKQRSFSQESMVRCIQSYDPATLNSVWVLKSALQEVLNWQPDDKSLASFLQTMYGGRIALEFDEFVALALALRDEMESHRSIQRKQTRKRADSFDFGDDDQDNIDTFVALGGETDGNGTVSIAMLRETCATFGLTLDLSSIPASDKPGGEDNLDFVAFSSILNALPSGMSTPAEIPNRNNPGGLQLDSSVLPKSSLKATNSSAGNNPPSNPHETPLSRGPPGGTTVNSPTTVKLSTTALTRDSDARDRERTHRLTSPQNSPQGHLSGEHPRSSNQMPQWLRDD